MYIQSTNALYIHFVLPLSHLVVTNSSLYSKSPNCLISIALAFSNRKPTRTPKLIHSLQCRLTNIDDHPLVSGLITQGERTLSPTSPVTKTSLMTTCTDYSPSLGLARRLHSPLNPVAVQARGFGLQPHTDPLFIPASSIFSTSPCPSTLNHTIQSEYPMVT